MCLNKAVTDIHGHPLSAEKQEQWKAARKMGLRPSILRYINGEPIAVYDDGSGIYGPCPPLEVVENAKETRIH